MSLLAQLEKDYVAAYKAKDSVRLGVLRLLKTALKNFQVEHMREPTDDDAFIILGRQCKQRQDSIEQYLAAGRPELAEKEDAELKVLISYMPPALEGEELAVAIAAAVAEVGATSMRDMGRVMQHLNTAYANRINGKVTSEAVKAALQAL